MNTLFQPFSSLTIVLKQLLREDEDCVDIFDIPFEKKEPIVMVLKEYYNLTARSIFSDLNGYIRNQKGFLKVALSNLANK